MAVLNLTESRIKDMEFGSGIWRDAQVKGLLVICHAATKTYAVQGDVRRNGRHIRTVRVKIDRVDRIGLREARNRARTIMSQIQSGVELHQLPANERSKVVTRAVNGHRGELRRKSAEARIAHVKEAGRVRDEVAAVRIHFGSPVQMLKQSSISARQSNDRDQDIRCQRSLP